MIVTKMISILAPNLSIVHFAHALNVRIFVFLSRIRACQGMIVLRNSLLCLVECPIIRYDDARGQGPADSSSARRPPYHACVMESVQLYRSSTTEVVFANIDVARILVWQRHRPGNIASPRIFEVHLCASMRLCSHC